MGEEGGWCRRGNTFALGSETWRYVGPADLTIIRRFEVSTRDENRSTGNLSGTAERGSGFDRLGRRLKPFGSP